MQGINKSRVIASLIWKWLERSSVQGVQFVIQIILARLVLPEEYGLIALITIFIAIANVFVQSGLNTALIQKKEADKVDFSSVFYVSLLIAIILYGVLFAISPIIASYYEESQLILIIRIMSITLIFGAINSIQNAFIARKMKFRLNFFSSLGGVCISGVIGIALAYMGYGVWALVWQQIINQLLVTVILWFTVKWRPACVFSLESIRGLFSYGWKVLGSSLISILTEKFYGAIIGKIYNSEMLGYFDRGHQFPYIIVNNTNGAITSVLLPTLSSQQENIAKVKIITRRAISISSFIVFPAMAGLAVIAEPLVKVLLTEKWLPCVPFLQLECLFYATMPLLTVNIQMNRAIGRSDIGLKLELLKAVLTFGLFYVCIPYGIYVMVGLRAFISLVMLIICIFISKKLIGYNFKDYFHDVIPSLLIAIIMAIIVGKIQLAGGNEIYTLLLQIVVGIVMYSGLAYIFKIESMQYIINSLKKR